MSDNMLRTFKRGIRDTQTLEAAKSFFCSPLGQLILNGNSNNRSPFQICIRDNYFNVYWNGCSVMKYRPKATHNEFTIHHKYIHGKEGKKDYLNMLPQRDTNVCDLKTNTDYAWSFRKNIVELAINGCHVPVLSEYVDSSKGNMQKEKALLKRYIESSESFLLIDLEVAFSRLNENNKHAAHRIDMAEIDYDDNNTPTLRLVEVKASSDNRLRAQLKSALMEHSDKIMYQMNIYQNFLNNEIAGITESYRLIASNMLELGFDRHMKGTAGKSATEVLQDFAARGIVDPQPHLLVLYSEQNRYVEDDHFRLLQDVIAQMYPRLRLVRVAG